MALYACQPRIFSWMSLLLYLASSLYSSCLLLMWSGVIPLPLLGNSHRGWLGVQAFHYSPTEARLVAIADVHGDVRWLAVKVRRTRWESGGVSRARDALRPIRSSKLAFSRKRLRVVQESLGHGNLSPLASPSRLGFRPPDLELERASRARAAQVRDDSWLHRGHRGVAGAADAVTHLHIAVTSALFEGMARRVPAAHSSD